MRDWLAFFLFDHRGPWQRWACARVSLWFALEEREHELADDCWCDPEHIRVDP